MQLHDIIWYPHGIPLMFLTMHNTKDTAEADALLDRISKIAEEVPKNYIAFNRSWFDKSNLLANGQRHGHYSPPCILV